MARPLPIEFPGALYHVMSGGSERPDLLRETVDAVNENTLQLVDLACESPASVVIMGDNFSSDIQPPAFFDKWSRPFYREALVRLHRAGKSVAVSILTAS